jgi:hypothetical protein
LPPSCSSGIDQLSAFFPQPRPQRKIRTPRSWSRRKPTPPRSPNSRRLPDRAPGSDLYVAQRGDSIRLSPAKYLRRTKYLTSSELAEAIRAANHNRQGVFLKSGEQIIIPGILESPIVEKSVQLQEISKSAPFI